MKGRMANKMDNIKSRIAKVVKIFGMIALVAAFATAAFPVKSFASTAREGAYGKAAITVLIAGSGPSASLQPLEGATVELINSNGVSVAKFATNSAGALSTGQAEGMYKVIVSYPGLSSVSAALAVKNGQTTYLTVKLDKLPIGVASGPGGTR
jgi:hypothetical protein